MDRVANDALHNQSLLNTANRQYNNLMVDLTNTRNDIYRENQMMIQALRDERQACLMLKLLNFISKFNRA